MLKKNFQRIWNQVDFIKCNWLCQSIIKLQGSWDMPTHLKILKIILCSKFNSAYTPHHFILLSNDAKTSKSALKSSLILSLAFHLQTSFHSSVSRYIFIRWVKHKKKRKRKKGFSFHHQSISIIKSMKCTEPSKNIVSIKSRRVMVEWMDGKRYHRIIYEKKKRKGKNNFSKRRRQWSKSSSSKKKIDEHTLYLNDNIFFNFLCID